MRSRKNKKFWVLTAISAFCFGLAAPLAFAKEPPADKPPVEISAGIDKRAVTIGDKIKYTIKIIANKGIEIEQVNFADNLGDLAIRDFGSVKKSSLGRQGLTYWYILDTYTTGKLTIPVIAVKYRKKGDKEFSEIKAPEQMIEVKSLSNEKGRDLEMRGIKEPVNLPAKFKYYLVPVLTAVFLFAAALAAYFLKKKKAKEEVSRKSAYEIACEQLAELVKKGYPSQGMIKEYYSEISGIIRHYLENRFNLRAPEMTTEEFLLSMRDAARLPVNEKGLLREFLTSCDLVKFAKYAPGTDEIEAVYSSAKRFIEGTKEEDTP